RCLARCRRVLPRRALSRKPVVHVSWLIGPGHFADFLLLAAGRCLAYRLAARRIGRSVAVRAATEPRTAGDLVERALAATIRASMVRGDGGNATHRPMQRCLAA